MRILVLSDEESQYLWDYFEQSKLEGIDLILSCGDLKPEYLSFLATFSKVPILYVRGNHDDIYDEKAVPATPMAAKASRPTQRPMIHASAAL